MKYFIRLIQFLFATTFVVSGISKCVDPAGTAIKLSEYLQYFGLTWLVPYDMFMSWVLCLTEFYCGFCLLIGQRRSVALILSTLLMIVFTPLTIWLAYSNAIEDCGCFGDLIHLSNDATLLKNVILDLMLIFLWIWRRKTYSLGLSRFFILFKRCMMVLAMLLCLFGTIYEPLIDFRPYLPGVNLRTTVLEVNDTDSIAYSFVYELNGHREEFDLESLPDEAEGWEFIETVEHHHVNSESAKSMIIDFYVKDESGQLFTEQLLNWDGYTLLLLSPSLDQASQHDIDRLEKLIEYADDNDYAFYCITGRDEGQLKRWKYNTGAEYQFLFTDVTVIETICRSNPCLLLLHNGTICWKEPLGYIDVETITSAKLNEQTDEEISEITPNHQFFFLLILLFAPIIIYLLVKIPKLVYIIITKKDSKDA